MKRSLSLFTLFGALAFGQYQDNPPNNGFFTGREYFPWDQAKTQACFFYKTVDIRTGVPTEVPAKNVSVAAFVSVAPNSGYHQHSGGARPYPTILSESPADAITDATGCVTYKWNSPANFSGWYTFQSSAIGFPSNGVNSRYRYHDWSSTGGILPFVPYNEGVGLVLNQPYGIHADPLHNPVPTGGYDYSRWGTKPSTDLALRISDTYFALSSSSAFQGVTTQLDIIRGSLPAGGVADNETSAAPYGPYLNAEYQIRSNELHQLGVEWDFGNPINSANGNQRAWDLFMRVITAYGCQLGYDDPNGNPLGPAQALLYWKNVPIVHVVCTVAPAAKH